MTPAASKTVTRSAELSRRERRKSRVEVTSSTRRAFSKAELA
jgi:hypothetical protein